MRNLDIFNCAALEILHASLDTFPIRASVKPQYVASKVREYFDANLEYPIENEQLSMICHSTIKWLEQEGFILIQMELKSGECLIVLTQKGLNALNSVPKFAEADKLSFGQYFKNGLKPIPFSLMSSLMTNLF